MKRQKQLLREPSTKLHDFVINITTQYGKLRESVQQAYALGREEGFTDVETFEFLKRNCVGVSLTTLYRYTPQEAKDKIKSENRRKGAAFYEEAPEEEVSQKPEILPPVTEYIENQPSLINFAELKDEVRIWYWDNIEQYQMSSFVSKLAFQHGKYRMCIEKIS